MNNLDYGKVFKVLVKETANYVKVNNLKAMVLGISGGIDSTVVAAICHEVSKQTTIPLIGRSLPIKNKSDEFDVSKLVGEAFCSDMCIYPGSLNLTSGVITVGGIANARNSIFKLMKSNLIGSNVSEECVTDKEFINFNDTY